LVVFIVIAAMDYVVVLSFQYLHEALWWFICVHGATVFNCIILLFFHAWGATTSDGLVKS